MDMKERYQNAEKLLPWNIKDAVLNGKPEITFLDDDHFMYTKKSRTDGEVTTEFVRVNCADGREEPLFDHKLLCELLGTETIPFERCEYDGEALRFVNEDHDMVFDLKENELTDTGFHNDLPESVSPDEKYTVFIKEYDLYLKEEDGKVSRLTFDGEENFAYANSAQYSGYISMKKKGITEKPGVLWSPDSRYFLTYKLDQRCVKDLYIIESFDDDNLESIRPRLHTYKCAFPEDEDIPLAYYYLYDTETKTMKKLDMEPQMTGGGLLSPFYSAAKWLDNSEAFYTAVVRRANESAAFYMVKNDGTVHKVLEETTDTFLNIHTFNEMDGFGDYICSNFLSEDRKTVIFQSERDGYLGLYRYDAETGECLKKITPDTVIVNELLYKDDEKETVWFMANNLPSVSDPCYKLLCSVKYDGSGFTVLTPEDGMHSVTMNGSYLVDTWSRVDQAPVTVLRKADGTLVSTVIEADISDLLDRGYVIPERFTVTASDGETVLYGILVRPRDFDENKSYPFVDYIYGGMQCYNVPKAFQYKASIEGREIMGGLEEFAQLGFAGIILDGLGTPGRGKKLHDISFRNIHGCAGLKDHVYCLKELHEKFPFLDLERAGMWGNSGGGCATSRAMLEYPDTYKAGVSSAGNHDQRMYNTVWTENYYGSYDRETYLKGDNTALAKNLKGKLFIVHGAMDDNVAMSQSIRLVDALIKEDKDFDFLILPRTNHNVPADPYFIRKKIDYFVKNLLQEEPADYRFKQPE